MPLNLRTCTGDCHNCVKQYAKKHRLGKDGKFDLLCKGIPSRYIPDNVLASLSTDPKTALAMVDPVTWASEFLDWHCIDPEGEIWKRKTADGSNGASPIFELGDEVFEGRALAGKSPYNRPYQATMLRCTSKQKIFRIGRQAGKTETLVISILFNLFTHEKFAIEVIAPYQAHIDIIFSRITDFIESNSSLYNSVERSVKAPNYLIKLKNDSYVIGFTAGTRSGQEAGASRGQHANMLVFDEADMLSPKDIDSALAVTINHPDATVWMSSTPTGRREKFYDNCLDSTFKEFHFPSYVNPLWTEEKDRFFRKQLTEDGYKHEVEASFGDQEEGVYQNKYVEAAQSDWDYGYWKPQADWAYMIGVDWNDVKIGTTIAVVGYRPETNQFYLVDKAIVSRAERTQLSACDKIAELNRYWNPSYIYVDQGYGGTQIEVLHDFGLRMRGKLGPRHPDAKLCSIVKAFDFGGTEEIHDPFTHQIVKKPAKPFLVENSVRRFETHSFFYPKSDESYTKQLLGYVIKRVSNTGRPIYEARDEKAGDHFLDAVNLALVAFAKEKTGFGKLSYSSHIVFTGKLGERSDSKERPATPVRTDLMSDVAAKHRPGSDRANLVNPERKLMPSPYGEIPGANMAKEKTPLWAWPGFGYDQPRPVTRTYKEAFRQAETRINRKRPLRSRPSRAKF